MDNRTGSDEVDRLCQLAERGTRHTFRKGAVLISEGDVSSSLFVIVSGRVRAYASNSANKEITFGIYEAGDYVGEMSLDGGDRSASVEALEKTECSIVAREAVISFISECPEFAFDILTRVIRRARLATQSARNMALLDSYSRLVNLLSELTESAEVEGPLILENLTHREIAMRIGTSREMVSKLLKDLEKGKYISTSGRRIELLRRLPAAW